MSSTSASVPRGSAGSAESREAAKGGGRRGTGRRRSAPSGSQRGPGGSLAIEIEPVCEYRLPGGGWPDCVSRTRAGVFERFLHVEGRPVLLRAWAETPRRVVVAAMPAPAQWMTPPKGSGLVGGERPGRMDAAAGPGRRSAAADAVATDKHLLAAIERGRRAIAVDDDLRDFRRRFRADPLLGPAIRRLPGFRVPRCPDPWEALLGAVVAQLIEAERAFLIERRIAARWASSLSFADVPGARPLRDLPSAAAIAARAPAEIASMDLAPKRAIALIAAAKEIAAGRCDPGEVADDARLAAIGSIGPWTLNCLRLYGRGDLDALPAGDLMFLKLVGHLASLGRRATVAEVEDFYAPYAPYRGLAGMLTLRAYGKRAAAAGPLPYHPPAPDYEDQAA